MTRSQWVLVLLLLAALSQGCMQAGRYGSPPAASNLPAPSPPPTIPAPPAPPAIQASVTETPVEAAPTPLPVRGDQPTLRLSFPFNSSGTEHLVSLALDPAALPSGSETCPLMSWRPGEEGALAAYYALIFKNHDEDALYTPLLSELRRMQRMEGLNHDEYLELMVHFVQGIPYDPDAPVCPRTPARVILDGKGDCDEKSLLLLGLLYREGYDAAILLFPAKHHATAGIRIGTATQPSFRVYESGGRKYVYIETTRPSLVGLYPDDFENENPVIIPTGNGTITYQAINDVMHIVSTQKRMVEKMKWLAGTCTEMLPEIESLKGKLTAGTSYTTQDEYDTDYSRYSTLVTRYNNNVDDFRQINEVSQYILDHQSDREGVSGRIANSKVENLL
jgi:hypothetical protein